MRLLVSVRDAGEARAALEGGADIVDAKEPSLGPLAPVAPDVLQSICLAVPSDVSLSVALGDVPAKDLTGIIESVAPLRRRVALYFKAAVLSSSAREAAPALAQACDAMKRRMDRPALIVARYVDAAADAANLADWLDASAASGAQGVLLDTSRKAGDTLLSTVEAHSLAALRRHAARRGIWLAVAGGVTLGDVDLLGEIRPHVVGVRGAVCDGARTGMLSTERVARLRRELNAVTTGQSRALRS